MQKEILRPPRPIRTSYQDEKQYKHDLLAYKLSCLVIQQAELMRADVYESDPEKNRRELTDYDRRPEILLRAVVFNLGEALRKCPSN